MATADREKGDCELRGNGCGGQLLVLGEFFGEGGNKGDDVYV